MTGSIRTLFDLDPENWDRKSQSRGDLSVKPVFGHDKVDLLRKNLHINSAEFESLAGLVRSQLDPSIAGALAVPGRTL